MASFIQLMAGVRSDDIIYIYLPLYHSAGFLMGLCGAIEKGDSLDNKTIKHKTPHSESTKGYFVQIYREPGPFLCGC